MAYQISGPQMRSVSSHQQALPLERIGGKVSPRLNGIFLSSGRGEGLVIPSVYFSNSYFPDTSHFSPVFPRTAVCVPNDMKIPCGFAAVRAGGPTLALHPSILSGLNHPGK